MCLIELRDDLQGVREFLRFFSVDRICSTMVGKGFEGKSSTLHTARTVMF